MSYPIWLNTSASNAKFTITIDPQADLGSFAPEPHSPLCHLQFRLQDGRLWWFGNRISDFRFWMWRLIR